MERDSTMINDTAARWLQRRESVGWTPDQDTQLEQWLDESMFHRVAFLRMEAAWEETGRLHALAPGFERRSIPDTEALRLGLSGPPERGSAAQEMKKTGRARFLAVAASFVITAIGAMAWYLQHTGDSYSTPVGGLASVPLKDGSSVALNTGSRIRVHLTETERRVELAQGEAYFDVARDPGRPFTVTAADKIITAVGTAFSVRRDGDTVQVVVASGRVKIEAIGSPSRVPTYLNSGGIVRTADSSFDVQQASLPQAEALLSWRTGYLVFHHEPLSHVVAEFNRYNDRKIGIADPVVDDIRLTGKFRATNTEALLRLLEESFDVTVRKDGNRFMLARSPGEGRAE